MSIYHIHTETGLPVVTRTGLVPVVAKVSLQTRHGMAEGEVFGVTPADAAVGIKNGAVVLESTAEKWLAANVKKAPKADA